MDSSWFWCCFALYLSGAFLVVFSCVYGKDIKSIAQVVPLTGCISFADIYLLRVCAVVAVVLSSLFEYSLHTMKQRFSHKQIKGKAYFS